MTPRCCELHRRTHECRNLSRREDRGGFVRGMTQPPVSLSQHLLTRSDLAKLGIPAGRILTWLGRGWLDQVGSLPGHQPHGDPVFAVLARELRSELADRLLELGKDMVVFSPLRVRSLLMRSMLLQQDPGKVAIVKEEVDPAVPKAQLPEADPVTEALLDPLVADAFRAAAHELVHEVDTVLELARQEARLEAIEHAAEVAANSSGVPMEDQFPDFHDDAVPAQGTDVDFFDADDLADELGVWAEDETVTQADVVVEAEVEAEVEANDAAEDASEPESTILEQSDAELVPDVRAENELVNSEVHETANATEIAEDETVTQTDVVVETEVEVEATDTAGATSEPESTILEQSDAELVPDVSVESELEHNEVHETANVTEIIAEDETATQTDVVVEVEAEVEANDTAEAAIEPESAILEQSAEEPTPEVVAEHELAHNAVQDSPVDVGEPPLVESNPSPIPNAAPTAEASVSEEQQADLEPLPEGGTATVESTPEDPSAAETRLGDEEVVPPQIATTTIEATDQGTLEDMLNTAPTATEPATDPADRSEPTFEEAAVSVDAAPEAEDPDLALATAEIAEEPHPVATSTSSDAAMQRVESFLGELRGVLVELASRPQPPAVDVQPLVAAVQQGFTQTKELSTATDTALASLTTRIGDFGNKVEHGVALAVHAALGNKSAAAAPAMMPPNAYVVPRQDRTSLALFAIGFLVLCWTVVFWFKTGNPRLALGSLIGANVIGCCLLVGRRNNS
jgi:hypothetical protein